VLEVIRRGSVAGLAGAFAVLLPLATPISAAAVSPAPAVAATPLASPTPSPSATPTPGSGGVPTSVDIPPSTPSSPINAAVAINTKNNSFLFQLAFSLVRIATDVVNPTNAAIAISSCTACTTVAIAIQIVLVTAPHPTVVTPGNVAVAVNYACTLCTTSAYAYQFLVMAGGPVHLTERGREELEAIREQLAALGSNPNLSPAARDAAIALLMQRLANVLATQLVAPDERGDRQTGEPSPHEADSHSPGPSPSGRTSSTPTASPSVTSTATPSARPSNAPTSSPTPVTSPTR
jgi:hypothetical protein